MAAQALITALRNTERISALDETGLLDTGAEEAFDRLGRLAGKVLRVPVVLISFVDNERHFLKSCIGLPQDLTTRRELPLSHSFCKHVVSSGEPLLVRDAREHPLLRDNPAVTDLDVIAYAGVPLVASGGHVLGTFCVADIRPRQWSEEESRILRDLAESAMTEIELRIQLREQTAAAEVEHRWIEEHVARVQAEEAQLKIANVLESITDGFVALDSEWRFTYVNGRAERSLGRSRAELLGRVIWDAFPPSQAAAFHDHCQQARNEQIPVHFAEYYPPNGRWYELDIFPSADGLSIYFRNITARKHAEAESRQRMRIDSALARVASAFAITPEADIHEVLSILGETLDVDRAFVFRFDIARSRVSTSHEWCAPGTEPQIEHLQSVDAAPIAGLMRALGAERVLAIGDVAAPPAEIAWDSAFLAAHGVRAALVVPIFAPTGELIGLVGLNDHRKAREWVQSELHALGVVGDMFSTHLARRAAEAALRASEQEHRGLFENAHDAILIFDPEDEAILHANARACQMYEVPREELIGMSIRSFSKDPSGGVQHVSRTLDADRPYSFETVQFRPDGSEMFLEINASPVQFRGRKAILSVNRDVTERRVLEEQLRQSQKMEAVGQLAGGVAHDFNNLLTAISGHTQLLLLDEEVEHVREDLLEIKAAAERAASLTQQLLAFSRKQVLEPKVFSPNATVAEMDRMLQRLIGEDINLRTVLASDLGAVRADPGQLEQVVLNLAVNARDAMREGGKLTIETRNVVLDAEYVSHHADVTPGAYVMLAISDTGCGIRPEVLPHIFEPFFTTKGEEKGTGLGLSTVYGIIKQSGGHVWVYSEVGHGTTFKIYLPRVETKLPDAPKADAPAALSGGSETVFLVEDEPVVRLLVQRVLERSGYKVLDAENGRQALDILGKHEGPLDLLITDVVMPQMGGRELAEQIRPQRPDLRVIYMSGYTDDAILHHGVLDPGMHFLHKPFTPDLLTRKVREVLGEVLPSS